MAQRGVTSRRVHPLVVVAGAVAVACAVVSATVSLDRMSLGDVAAMLLFSGLVVGSVHLDVIVRPNMSISGHVIVLTAALVVFGEGHLYFAIAVVAASNALYLPLWRQRKWDAIIMDASTDSMGLLAGAAVSWTVIHASGGTADLLVVFIATSIGASAYLLINAFLVTGGQAVVFHEPWRPMLAEALRYQSGAYPFALIGIALGWVYLTLGGVVVPLVVMPILIARSAFASYLDLKRAQENTIDTLIRALEAKDRYTAGHAQRVAMFAGYMAEEFELGPRRCERLRYAALMHDIGKLVVPNQLLNKPGRLTEAEFDRVRRHESVSVELLHRIDFLAPVAGDTTTEAASAAVDGSGLIEPAIIHVADAFDAMTSTRSYRRALSQETAFAELRKGTGTQFNGACVEALVTAIERRGERYGEGHETAEHEWEVAPPEAGTGSAGLGDLVDEEPPADARHEPQAEEVSRA
jgi:hypothetical protein